MGPGLFAARRDFVDDDLAGSRTRVKISGLPENAILRDFHIETNGNIMFCLDIGVTPGGIYYAPADVIRIYGSSFGKEFDSVAAGVHCDGVARRGANGPLLLSFDRTFTVADATIRPADVIEFSNGVFGPKLLDARALGLADNCNVDAIDMYGTIDYLLVSFDGGGSINDIPFSDEDVMQLHLTDGTWSMRFMLLAFSIAGARRISTACRRLTTTPSSRTTSTRNRP